MSKTFVTIFPTFQNLHFYKDPGQIPFRLKKIGYESKIVCYNNGKIQDDIRNQIEITSINKSKLNEIFNLGVVKYIILNAKKIHVLNTFHFSYQSLLFLFLYKKINKNGISYLKMDHCHYSGNYSWEDLLKDKNNSKFTFRTLISKNKFKNYLIKNVFIKKLDLVSVEDEFSCRYYNKTYPEFNNKIFTLFNGHCLDLTIPIKIKRHEEKDNIILCSGRHGTFQKATEFLLKAFVEIVENNNMKYKLYLAGPVTNEFHLLLNQYLNDSKYKEKIVYTGNLIKEELYELYNKSKIFCLPSRFEGFAISYAEAMYFRNAIITTKYTALKDTIEQNNMGCIIEKESVKELKEKLLYLTNNEEIINTMANNATEYAQLHFDWNNIIKDLDLKIKSINA